MFAGNSAGIKVDLEIFNEHFTFSRNEKSSLFDYEKKLTIDLEDHERLFSWCGFHELILHGRQGQK